MSAIQQSPPSTSASLSTNLAAKHSNSNRCDLCRLKFPNTDLGGMEQQAHRGTGEDCHPQAEKGKKKSGFQGSAATSHNIVYPSKDGYPALFSGGSSSSKCDLCGERINLGENDKGRILEMHRNPKMYRKGQRDLDDDSRCLTADEQLGKPKGLLKFFERMSSQSQASLDGSKAPSSKGSSKLKVESLSIPRVPADVKTENMKSKSPAGDRGVRPADADRTTLARDIQWALRELPAGTKRKNVEDNGNVQKKPRDRHCEMDLAHW